MSKMIIITPDEVINKGANKINAKSVFLAGTIDNGNSEDWQQTVIQELDNLGIAIEVYNPRRKNWNPNPTKEDMEKQITWEQDHLDKSDVIAMVIADNSKSPITLLELGLYAKSNKLVVFCTPNFYRWDNVRLTCKKYHIELIQDLHPLIIANKIIAKL